jgi:hypothetical protein
MLYKSGNKFYKRLQVGSGSLKGMYLWQEVKRFAFIVIPTKNKFWLDDMWFYKVK